MGLGRSHAELARLYREENRMAEAASCYLRKLGAAGHDIERLLESTVATDSMSAAIFPSGPAPTSVDAEQVEGVLFLPITTINKCETSRLLRYFATFGGCCGA